VQTMLANIVGLCNYQYTFYYILNWMMHASLFAFGAKAKVVITCNFNFNCAKRKVLHNMTIVQHAAPNFVLTLLLTYYM
jgi:hypothetical protein